MNKLSQLAREFQVPHNNIHALVGAPERALPAFAAAKDYDVIAMGALTHRKGIRILVETLTSHLVDTVDCVLCS